MREEDVLGQPLGRSSCICGMKSGQVGWSVVNLRGQDAGRGWGEQGCEVQAPHLVQASDCCSLLECDNRD